MSAPRSQAPRYRVPLPLPAHSAGSIAMLSVALAGATLGFFAWYVALPALQNPVLSDLALPVLVAVGIIAVLYLWGAYAGYLARRTGITLARSLQYDSLAWIPMLLLWLSFALPPELTHGARLFVACALLAALVKVGIAARFNQTVRDVLVTFVLTRSAIIVIAELAAVTIGQRAGTHVSESSHLLLAVWGRWDAVHYLTIAERGYLGTDMAFFPLYPLTIAALGSFLGNHLIAGFLISNACFFFGLLYLYKLLAHEYDRAVARRAIFYISIFPSAIFFSAVYTESLFFMLTVASFYYMREKKWWAAGIFGCLAALTRVEGVLLLAPFFFEWFAAYRDRWSSALRQLCIGALIPFGMALYMGYLWVLRGDPLYFSHVQAHWHRHLAPPWVSVINSVTLMVHATRGNTIANQALELAFTALMIGVLVGGWKRLRPSYIAYMGLSILVPMSTSSLMSMPRFALVLFPMFAILARWGGKPWVNTAIVAFSLPLLGLFTVLFADWYWVA
ncbi:MAG: mannosyltransferase family protein [Bacillati bacterium]